MALNLLTAEKVDTIKLISERAFNFMEAQIKSMNERADLTKTSINERITECFIKLF